MRPFILNSHPAIKFVNEEYFRTLLILFSSMTFVYSLNNMYFPGYLRFFLPWLLLGLVLATEQATRILLLIAISILNAFSIFIYYYEVANHAFFILYISLALLIAVLTTQVNEKLLRNTAFYLLALLMGFALIQKLSSSYYMSGNLMAEYVLTGVIYKKIISFFIPDWASIVQHNVEVRSALTNTLESNLSVAGAIIPTGVHYFIWFLTYSSLLIQLLLEIALLLKARLGVWVHYSILLFVVIIYSTVSENIFLSANCVLGYAITDSRTESVRKWYVLFVFFLLTMELTGLRLPVFN